MQPDRTTNETAVRGQDSSQITVGVDGSPASLAGLRWAHEQASRRSTTLTVLTVWPAPATSGTPAIPSGSPTPYAQVQSRKDQRFSTQMPCPAMVHR
jgi:Universal stress protein family